MGLTRWQKPNGWWRKWELEGLWQGQLIIDHDLGVATQRTYVVKRIDSDFFGEE